jgi:hypothetical protein
MQFQTLAQPIEMPSSKSTPPSPPSKPKRAFRWIIKPMTLIWLLLIISAIALVAAAFIQKDWKFLFTIKKVATGELGELAIILAPLTALALAIERVIETVFDFFEQSMDEIAKLSSGTEKTLEWFNTELEKAWESAKSIAEDVNNATDDAQKSELLKKLEEAEERISKATSRIYNLKNDPKYVATKRMLSIWLGLLLGLLVAIISDEGIFEYLHIGVPRLMDMLVTGFILGAGSGPMHSLIGILQGAKDSLENLGQIATLGAVRKEIADLKGKLPAS